MSDTFRQDVRSALRVLFRSRGFAVAAVIMLALVVATMVAGRLLAIPADDLFGVVSGVTGNPAILVYANRAFPTERTDIGYAMVFPTVTVGKILFVQIAAVVLGG